MDIMRQHVCLVVNPIRVYSYVSSLHDGGSGLRLNDNTDIKLSPVGWCPLSLASPAMSQLQVFVSFDESRALFLVSSKRVNLIRLFICDDAFYKLRIHLCFNTTII